METIPSKNGKKAIKFKRGALHKELNVASDKKIPAEKMRAALSGADGDLAKRRALFSKNVLTGGK
jgi:hypothetical protein